MLALPSHRERPHPPALMEALSLPLAVAASLRFTPEAFAELCAANPDAVLERAKAFYAALGLRLT